MSRRSEPASRRRATQNGGALQGCNYGDVHSHRDMNSHRDVHCHCEINSHCGVRRGSHRRESVIVSICLRMICRQVDGLHKLEAETTAQDVQPAPSTLQGKARHEARGDGRQGRGWEVSFEKASMAQASRAYCIQLIPATALLTQVAVGKHVQLHDTTAITATWHKRSLLQRMQRLLNSHKGLGGCHDGCRDSRQATASG